jgi:hypothetical protein
MKKDTDSLRKELEQEAPFLAGLKDKPDGLSTPEGYFGQLRQDVLSRIEAEKALPAGKTRPLWPRLAIAASVVALIGAVLFLFRPAPSAPEPAVALTAEEVHQYIADNIDEFDLELLLPYATASQGSWMENADFDDPAMQQYMNELLDEIDLETLEELL